MQLLSTNFLWPLLKPKGGGNGGLRYYGIELFPSGIWVILILMCGITVSSSLAAYGFFILLANGIR